MAEKRLYRSTKNRMLFGVAGGIGEYFNVDPTIVRLVFVILTIWGGVGIVLYIIGIFLIPEENESKTDYKKSSTSSEDLKKNVESVASDIKDKISKNNRALRGDQIFGLIILLIGVIFLFNAIFPFFNFWRLWPLALIAIGIAFLAGEKKKDQK